MLGWAVGHTSQADLFQFAGVFTPLFFENRICYWLTDVVGIFLSEFSLRSIRRNGFGSRETRVILMASLILAQSERWRRT